MYHWRLAGLCINPGLIQGPCLLSPSASLSLSQPAESSRSKRWHRQQDPCMCLWSSDKFLPPCSLSLSLSRLHCRPDMQALYLILRSLCKQRQCGGAGVEPECWSNGPLWWLVHQQDRQALGSGRPCGNTMRLCGGAIFSYGSVLTGSLALKMLVTL